MYRWSTNHSKASPFSVLRWRIRKHTYSGEHLQTGTLSVGIKKYSTGIKWDKNSTNKENSWMTDYHISIKILNTLWTEINFEKVKWMMENMMIFNFVIKTGPYTLSLFVCCVTQNMRNTANKQTNWHFTLTSILKIINTPTKMEIHIV